MTLLLFFTTHIQCVNNFSQFYLKTHPEFDHFLPPPQVFPELLSPNRSLYFCPYPPAACFQCSSQNNTLNSKWAYVTLLKASNDFLSLD